VVYRGRCPGGAGPDVRGALVAFADGQLIEGDVEFHLRTSDWRAHGHRVDGQYRSVILHVVAAHDAPAPTGPDGFPLPTLLISRESLASLDRADEAAGAAACHLAARERGPEAVGTLLDTLGDRRLIQRAARFEAELTRLTPDQLAFEMLCDALGFSRNRSPFVRLAQAVPIDLLSALAGRRPAADALVLVQAILFGVAGLLPSQRPTIQLDWEADALAEEIEAIWSLSRPEWDGLGLTADDWVFGGVRPANYPTRRIATAAYLVVRYREGGLAAALLAPLGGKLDERRHFDSARRSGPDPNRRADTNAPDSSTELNHSRALPNGGSLERLFVVDDPATYWATHADFGRPLPGGAAALLGRDRARDAAVNVVLPLALAVAASTNDQPLADRAWQVYRAFPRPAVYDVTQRLARDLGLGDQHVASARRQQGLLHLARNHCEGAACLACPLLAHSDLLS
jgi:hypothetical protein